MIKLEGVKNSKEGIWHYVVFYKDGAHLSEMGKRRYGDLRWTCTNKICKLIK